MAILRALRRFSGFDQDTQRAIDAIWEWTEQFRSARLFEHEFYAEKAVDGSAGAQFAIAARRATRDFDVQACRIWPNATLAAGGAASATFKWIRHRGDGAALSAGLLVASLNTSATGFVARIPRDFTLVDENRRVKLGEWLVLHVEKTGAGQVTPASSFVSEIRWV